MSNPIEELRKIREAREKATQPLIDSSGKETSQAAKAMGLVAKTIHKKRMLGAMGIGSLVAMLKSEAPKTIATYEGKPVLSNPSIWDRYIKPAIWGLGATYIADKVMRDDEGNIISDINKMFKKGEANAPFMPLSDEDRGQYDEALASIANIRPWVGWHSYVPLGMVAFNRAKAARRNGATIAAANQKIDEFNQSVKAFRDSAPAYKAEMSNVESAIKKTENMSARAARINPPKKPEMAAKLRVLRQQLDTRLQKQLTTLSRLETKAPKKPTPYELSSADPSIRVKPARQVPGKGLVAEYPVVKNSLKAKRLSNWLMSALSAYGAYKSYETAKELDDAKRDIGAVVRADDIVKRK